MQDSISRRSGSCPSILSLSGRITRADTGEPLSSRDVQITAKPVVARGDKVLKTLGKSVMAFADKDGRYSFVGLQPGQYQIWIASHRPELRNIWHIVDFSAGGDLGMIEDRASEGAAQPGAARGRIGASMRSFYGLFLCVRDLPCPVVAAINGHAVGAGLCVALACDVRVASDAAKLGLNFTRLGLHPGMGATWTLPRLVGPARASYAHRLPVTPSPYCSLRAHSARHGACTLGARVLCGRESIRCTQIGSSVGRRATLCGLSMPS